MPYSGYRTGDQALVRDLNRAILLSQLRHHAPQSRASLARLTGLNKATISSLVGELSARGVVREVGPASSSGGRPAALLDLNPRAGYIIGAELNVDYINVILTNFRTEIMWRKQALPSRPADQAQVMGQVIALIKEAREVAAADEVPVLGLGLGAPGLVDIHSGRMLFAPNLGWHDAPLRDLLTAQFDFPVWVDNDANAAALGEWYFGSAQQVDDFVYLSANIGLGVGIMLGGQVHRGSSGYAGEVGHTVIDPSGPRCNCGSRGCWETFASQRALLAAVRTGWQAADNSIAAEEINMDAIITAVEQEDPVALAALDEIGTYLGIGFANLINVFNPDKVVFGGTLSTAADHLLPVIERTVATHALRWSRESVEICASAFRFDACVMGGVALVLHNLFSYHKQVMRTA
ncbi:MAG: ROK family protein [Anaerolineae bacterium]